MSLPKRDVIATVLVVAAVVLYGLWLVDAALPGLDSVRATGIAILGLGFVASASAVVPGFDELLHGNKAYMAVASIMGLVAFVAGLLVVVAQSEPALGVLVIAMVVLWIVATAHHTILAGQVGHALGSGRPRAAAH